LIFDFREKEKEKSYHQSHASYHVQCCKDHNKGYETQYLKDYHSDYVPEYKDNYHSGYSDSYDGYGRK